MALWFSYSFQVYWLQPISLSWAGTIHHLHLTLADISRLCNPYHLRTPTQYRIHLSSFSQWPHWSPCRDSPVTYLPFMAFFNHDEDYTISYVIIDFETRIMWLNLIKLFCLLRLKSGSHHDLHLRKALIELLMAQLKTSHLWKSVQNGLCFIQVGNLAGHGLVLRVSLPLFYFELVVFKLLSP